MQTILIIDDVPITRQLTFHAFSGLENDHNAYLSALSLVHDWTYASNFMYEGQIFDVALYPLGSSRTVRFGRPGIRVFCNIHPSMSAIIVVVDSKDFTTTDSGGRYSLPKLSAGKYQVHFFAERATAETLAMLTQDIVVGTDVESLPVVAISEGGYLPAAHKNKYGQTYPVDHDKTDTHTPQMR